MAVKLYEDSDDHKSGWIIAIIVILCLIAATSRCHAQQTAQIDTMLCKIECIKKFIEKPTANGKSTKFYAVYNDPKIGFSEVIPVSKTVLEYIEVCKQNSIQPTLGIRLRNGVVSSIIRYKIKFVKK